MNQNSFWRVIYWNTAWISISVKRKWHFESISASQATLKLSARRFTPTWNSRLHQSGNRSISCTTADTSLPKCPRGFQQVNCQPRSNRSLAGASRVGIYPFDSKYHYKRVTAASWLEGRLLLLNTTMQHSNVSPLTKFQRPGDWRPTDWRSALCIFTIPPRHTDASQNLIDTILLL